jgi:hypothetical protein
MAMTSCDSYLSEKIRLFSRVQTDLKKMPVHDFGVSRETTDRVLALRSFDKFVRNSIFPVIRDDFLLSYLPKDLIVGTTESSSLA